MYGMSRDARGCKGGGVFFMIKPKNIGNKMRYSNLSNDMLIQQLQYEQ